MRIAWILVPIAIAACTSQDGEGDPPAPVADASVADTASPTPIPDAAPAPVDAQPIPDAALPACRPPLPRVEVFSDVPVQSGVAAASPNGEVVVAGAEACSGGTVGVYRVRFGQAPVRISCLGAPSEVVVGIAADATGIAVLTRYAATDAGSVRGARLHRLKTDGTKRDEPLSKEGTGPTAVALVGGVDVFATLDGSGASLWRGAEPRPLVLADQTIAALAAEGTRLLALVMPAVPSGTSTGLVLRKWALAPAGNLIDDANFGTQGSVSVSASPSSLNSAYYTSTSITMSGGVTAVGIPVAGAATARFLAPGVEHTVGPVGSGVQLVSVAHGCDGALLVAHPLTLESTGVSRFAKPGTDPMPDPAWASFMVQSRARGLLTLTGGDFAVVGEITSPTRVLRLSKLAQ